MKHILIAAALASGAFVAAPSSAATVLPSCASIGLDDIVPGAEACVGYLNKNVLKTSAGDSAKQEEVDALNLLGLFGTTTDPIKVLEKLEGSGDFASLLNGLTYIGVHYGAGNGPVNTPGGVTAFYRFNAGTNLDSISFTNGSISGVALYATQSANTPDAVPEPATWAMMVGGFGLIGAASRRRKTNTMFA